MVAAQRCARPCNRRGLGAAVEKWIVPIVQPQSPLMARAVGVRAEMVVQRMRLGLAAAAETLQPSAVPSIAGEGIHARRQPMTRRFGLATAREEVASADSVSASALSAPCHRLSGVASLRAQVGTAF